MRFSLVAFALVAGAFAQTNSLTITPAVLTQCHDRGLATAGLSWRTSESAVQIRVGSASGPAMTGFEPGSGGATSGPWVTDGLVFVLVSNNGREVARVAATVRCRAANANLVEQLATQSYLPLEVGNRWVYRYNDRSVTGKHLVRWVDRTVVERGETWYVVAEQGEPGGAVTESRTRTDEAGRIFVQGALFLDPSPNPSPDALATVQQRHLTVSTIFGSLPNGLSYAASRAGLILQRGTYVRGVGLVSLEESLQTGSSGGFLYGLQLVEAVIAGRVRFSSPANGLEISPESQVLDVTGKQVRNCALPCYFVACGLAGGRPDPPGTYKPCLFTRIKLENPEARSVAVELVNAGNEAVFSVDRPLAASANEHLWFETISLYASSGALLPVGAYELRATVKSERGETLNRSTTALRID